MLVILQQLANVIVTTGNSIIMPQTKIASGRTYYYNPLLTSPALRLSWSPECEVHVRAVRPDEISLFSLVVQPNPKVPVYTLSRGGGLKYRSDKIVLLLRMDGCQVPKSSYATMDTTVVLSFPQIYTLSKESVAVISKSSPIRRALLRKQFL